MKQLLYAIWHLIRRSLPWVAFDSARANDMSLHQHYDIAWTLYKSDWWRAWGQKAECGCTYAFGKRRLILMDCPKHGWDTWFENEAS